MPTAVARALATVLTAAAFGCSPPSVSHPPSIVLITIDTLRADHLHTYGYFRETSPNIDAFAEDALVFENAIAPMATTLPTHVSIMTSANPARHGVLSNLRFFKTPLKYYGRAADGSADATASGVSDRGIHQCVSAECRDGNQHGVRDISGRPGLSSSTVVAARSRPK